MRLTIKDNKNDYDVYKGSYNDIDCDGETIINVMAAYRKLGQLEDIEEELGIDLATLFKALKQGYIWYDEEKYKIECLYMKPRIHLYVADGVGGCYMEDYGKTWALTKEDLL